jgi:carboxyl-terminal processing protease
VYGGGGIMPDYFIPLDTSFVSNYYTDILRKGLHNDYTMQYIDSKRKDLLKQYPDIKAFKAGFTNDQKLLDDFVAFAAGKGVARNDKDLSISGEQLTTVLKALIARNLFNMNAQFEILGTNDDELLKAVEVIKNDALFQKLSQTK